MYPRIRTLVGVAAACSLAVPATALSHERSSPRSVGAHLARADASLERVAELVGDRDQAAAAVAFARNRSEMRRAQAEATRAARSGTSRGARALAAVARRQDAGAETLVALVPAATGGLEVDLAKAAASNLKGRDRAFAQLAALAGRLPAAAQQGIARAMARVVHDGEDDVAAAGEAIESGAVGEVAKPWLELAIARMTAGIATAASQLEALLPGLPAVAQGPVQQALDRVRSVVGAVTGILQGIFGGGSDAGSPAGGGLPVPSGLPIPEGLPIPKGLPIPFGPR